jgi:NTE family protein
VLSDGGVYDNMGLEPVWKSHATVLVSDGGKPLAVDRAPGTAVFSRLLRANAVIGNQAEALRKRWLIDSYERGVYGGAYWGIGTEIDGYPCFGGTPAPLGYRGDVLAGIRAVRTDLDDFHEGLQGVLRNHGWALADAALRSFSGVTDAAPRPPVPELFDPTAAARALTA